MKNQIKTAVGLSRAVKIGVCAVIALALSACGVTVDSSGQNGETSNEQTISVQKAVIWAGNPLDVDAVFEIVTQDNFVGTDELEEKKGYGQEWYAYSNDTESDFTYSPDGIVVQENGSYGIRTFDGTVLIDGLPGSSYYDGTIVPSGYRAASLYGISLQNGTVLSSDYRSVIQLGDAYDMGYAGDAGLDFVNENGQLMAGIPNQNDSIPYKDSIMATYASGKEMIVARVNTQTLEVLGSAKVKDDGTVLFTTDYPLYDTSDPRGYVNGFYVTSFYSGKFQQFGQENTEGFGLVNGDTGTLITKEKYQKVKWFEDGYCPVEKNDKWGFIDESGNEVTDFIFDDASALYDGKSYVKLNGQYRILDLKDTLDQGIPVTTETVQS